MVNVSYHYTERFTSPDECLKVRYWCFCVSQRVQPITTAASALLCGRSTICRLHIQVGMGCTRTTKAQLAPSACAHQLGDRGEGGAAAGRGGRHQQLVFTKRGRRRKKKREASPNKRKKRGLERLLAALRDAAFTFDPAKHSAQELHNQSQQGSSLCEPAPSSELGGPRSL